MTDSPANTAPITLLKLGGSLITEKDRPRTLRPDTLSRIAVEIASALQENSSLRLILGHGAGSFAHVSAARHRTRDGVRTAAQWQGFSEVWWDAATLNHLVIGSLRDAGLPAIALSPSASVVAKNGVVSSWDLRPLNESLNAGLLPVIHGDVIFDYQRGGTILSTEELFMHLARQLQPRRMLLAGIEPGVWNDYPHRTRVIPKITPKNVPGLMPSLEGADTTDVTGGMRTKVMQCLELCEEISDLEIMIFSGDTPGAVAEVLSGAQSGTVISNY